MNISFQLIARSLFVSNYTSMKARKLNDLNDKVIRIFHNLAHCMSSAMLYQSFKKLVNKKAEISWISLVVPFTTPFLLRAITHLSKKVGILEKQTEYIDKNFGKVLRFQNLFPLNIQM